MPDARLDLSKCTDVVCLEKYILLIFNALILRAQSTVETR